MPESRTAPATEKYVDIMVGNVKEMFSKDIDRIEKQLHEVSNGKFMTRIEFEAKHDMVVNRITTAENAASVAKGLAEGKASIEQVNSARTFSAVIMVIGWVATVAISLLLRFIK